MENLPHTQKGFSRNRPRCHMHHSQLGISCHRAGARGPVLFLPPLLPVFCFYGAGCACACSAASVASNSLQLYGLQPTRLLCPWDSPGKNTGVGCHALLQGTFPTQRLNPRLLYLLHRQEGALPPPGKPENYFKMNEIAE